MEGHQIFFSMKNTYVINGSKYSVHEISRMKFQFFYLLQNTSLVKDSGFPGILLRGLLWIL